MFNFIKNFLKKREGKNKYKSKIQEFVSDWELNIAEKKELKKIAEEYKLDDIDLSELHRMASSTAFKNIISDERITEEEKKNLQELVNYFWIELKDFNFDQKAFNKYYTLSLIDKWTLPEIKEHNLDIIFKKWEVLHWACAGSLKKYKRITNKINYGGLGASIKIMKGVRYRVGSTNVSTSSTEHLMIEDVGTFWLTNERIWFKWSRKNFTFAYEKIHTFELNNAWLTIAKDGKETPYIVWLEDYDIPCLMISNIINNLNE